MAPSGEIVLSPKGANVAKNIYGRHKLLTSFLEMLGVDHAQAEEDACKVEHDLSDEAIACIQAFMDEARK